LEAIISAPISYFAYPYGEINSSKECRQILNDCGYRAAVTLIPGFNYRSSDVYLLHRDIVRPDLCTFDFLARCLGNKDFIYYLSRLLK